MDTVFISYAREDAEAARMVADALEKAKIPVWWDRHIPPGKTWDEVIGRALDAAACVIVLWSRTSVESRYVREEAVRAASRNCLIPVFLEKVAPPFGFGLIQAADLSGWRGDDQDPKFTELLAAVSALTKTRSLGPERPAVNPLPVQQHIRGALHAGVRSSGAQASDPRVVDRPINLGFDGPTEGGFPYGWFDSHGHVSNVSTDYKVRVVQRDDSVPGMCLKLSKDGARPGEFGSVMQRFPASFLAGHTVRLEGEIRTEKVSEWAGFWLRADGEEAADLFFDNMHGRGLSGTTPWARHAVEGKLPRETAWVNLGVVLCGNGIVYSDSLRFLRWTNEGAWIDV
jgi:hypothetical protein